MKKGLYCLTILIVALLSSTAVRTAALAQEEVTPAQKAFDEGQQAFYKGLYQDAITLFQKALGLAPEEASYGVALGKAYYAAGKTVEAQKQFEDALKLHPTSVEAGKELAAIYTGQKEWQKVFDLLTNLLPYKHDYFMFRSLAEAAYRLGKTGEAKGYYREALRFNDSAPFDRYQLGDIYLTESKFRLAAREYSRALELGLDDALIHYKLATAYFNLKNYLGQVEIRQVPGGVAEQISDDFFLIEAVPGATDSFQCAPAASAIYQLGKAMDMDIQTPEARLLLANIYFYVNRFERAISLLLEIENTIEDEDKEGLYTCLGEAYFHTGQYEQYLDAVQKATAKDPEGQKQALTEAHHSIAKRYEQLGDTPNQINYLLKCVDGAATNAQYHLELGDAYHRQKDYPNAVAQWRMVLDLQPDHPEQMRITNLIKQLAREGKE